MTEAVRKTFIPQPGVLILSDLQFGLEDKEIGRENYGIELHHAGDSARAILEAVAPIRNEINLLILPGDLTSTGRVDEFEALRKYLDVLLNPDEAGLNPVGVVMAPGNHDLFAEDSGDPLKRFKNYLHFKRTFYADYWLRFGRKKMMRAPWMGVASISEEVPDFSKIETSPNDIWTVYNFKESLSSYVVSFNSAADIACQEGEWAHKAHFGFIDPKGQLKEVRNYVMSQQAQLRNLAGLAVLHHNIAHARPVDEKMVRAPGQIGIVRNYDEVIEALQSLRISLVIHGHQHEARITTQKLHGPHKLEPAPRGTENDPAITIFGARSAGCKPSELAEGAQNGFHFIQFEAHDPVHGRQISYETYQIAMTSVDAGSTWRREYKKDVTLPILSVNRTISPTFSLIEQANIATAPTRDQAFERLTAFLKSRVGYPVIGASLVASRDLRHMESRRMASTFAESDCKLLDSLYECTESPKAHPHRSLTIELGAVSRPELKEARERLDTTQYIRFLQSQLMLYRRLSVVTYWFEVGPNSWIGLQVHTMQDRRHETVAAGLDALAVRKLITAVLVYWSLDDRGDIQHGPIKEEPNSLTGILEEAVGELFKKDIRSYWKKATFKRLESRVYAAKRDIEKLIVYSIIHREVERSRANTLHVDKLARRVRKRLDRVRKKILWAGQELGRSIDPLLVAFWVPLTGASPRSDAWQNAPLHYLFTRDQIAACGFQENAEVRAATMNELRKMLSMEMLRYGDLVFDGISAYVRASEAPYTSLDAYRDPLVAFDKFTKDRKDELPPGTAPEIDQFRQRSEQRSQLTGLEQRFWGQQENVAVFVAPLWGRHGVEAVLQIQTGDTETIKTLQSVDFFSALDGVNFDVSSAT